MNQEKQDLRQELFHILTETENMFHFFKRLTGNQQKFVVEYMKLWIENGGSDSGIQTKAYTNAGGKAKNAYVAASKIVRMGKVSEALANFKKYIRLEDYNDVVFTFREAMNRANKIYNRAMEAEEVCDKQGNPTGFFTFHAHGALGANDQMIKMAGYYEKDNEQASDKQIIVVDRFEEPKPPAK